MPIHLNHNTDREQLSRINELYCKMLDLCDSNVFPECITALSMAVAAVLSLAECPPSKGLREFVAITKHHSQVMKAAKADWKARH